MDTDKTVLLIDDDEDDREMLQQALHSIDTEHRIVEATDGKAGLVMLNDMLSENKLPCLIVLDINMPKLDGKQAFVAIKSNETLSKIPVVIFSTSSNPIDRMFFEKNNTAYFVKPVKVDDLAAAARYMMFCCRHKLPD